MPDCVRVDDVGPVTWQTLLRDGVLVPVWGDVAVPAGRPAGPDVRALAVRCLVPPRAVLGRAAAVWVHAGGPQPARFAVLVAPKVRRPSPHPARVPHECPLPAGDVVRLGDVAVTTVGRTAVDVARHLPEDEAVVLLRRLAAHTGLDLTAVRHAAAALGARDGGPRVRGVLARAQGPGPPSPPQPSSAAAVRTGAPAPRTPWTR